jgi:predicted NBD/HSP70 family sugar kinase
VAGAPGSLESLRELNRLRVLETLRRRGSVSRADIARETGLSRTTVSSLVAALLEEGVVVERPDPVPAPSPSGGRPPTLLTLDPSSGAVVGIDFGHAGVRVAVADLSCAVLAEAHREVDVDHHAAGALACAADLALSLLDEVGVARTRVLGAGVALSAPLRTGSRMLASTSILPGWVEIDAGAELRRRLELPVHVDNDANLGALAEATFGAGRGVDNLIYVLLSAGVGGGLVLNGRLYEGATGTAGELGHVVVSPDGFVCRCGNRGCLETVASLPALVHALRHSRGPDLTAADVLELALRGEPGASRVVADAGRAVGRALAGICSMLDPRLIVVGGEIAATGNLVLDGIRESIVRATAPSIGHPISVVAGQLGEQAEVLGAIALVMNSTTTPLPVALAATS